jgi:hypothetical protein
MVGVGTGDCGAIGGVVTLMPAASRGGTGDGGGDIEGDGNTTGVMIALGAGDGVTLLGAGVAVAPLAPGAGEVEAAAAAPSLGDEEAAALGSGIARGAS